MNNELEKKYRLMENSFIQYRDLLNISKCNETTDNEKFVILPPNGNGVVGRYEPDFSEMEDLVPQPIVRDSVYKKLCTLNNTIRQRNSNWQLLVTEGFRDLSIQTIKHNNEMKKFMAKGYSPEKAKATAHYWVAFPDVASHPTGGAVDISIFDNKAESIIDFGAKIYDFKAGPKQYVFSPEVENNVTAMQNRIYLRKLMMSEGFAPFDGEWWHFSYGDKEWAVYYGFDEYLYKQKQLSEIRIKGE